MNSNNPNLQATRAVRFNNLKPVETKPASPTPPIAPTHGGVSSVVEVNSLTMSLEMSFARNKSLTKAQQAEIEDMVITYAEKSLNEGDDLQLEIDAYYLSVNVVSDQDMDFDEEDHQSFYHFVGEVSKVVEA